MTRRNLSVDTNSSPLASSPSSSSPWSPVASEATTPPVVYRSMGLVHRHTRTSLDGNSASKPPYYSTTPSKSSKRRLLVTGTYKRSVSHTLWAIIIVLYTGSAYLWYKTFYQSSTEDGLPPIPEAPWKWSAAKSSSTSSMRAQHYQTRRALKRKARVTPLRTASWDSITVSEPFQKPNDNYTKRDLAIESHTTDEHVKVTTCGSWLSTNVTVPIERVLFTFGPTSSLDASLINKLLDCSSSIQVKVILPNPGYFTQAQRREHWLHLETLPLAAATRLEVLAHDYSLGTVLKDWIPTHVIHPILSHKLDYSDLYKFRVTQLSLQQLWDDFADVATTERPHLFLVALSDSDKATRLVDTMSLTLQHQRQVFASSTVWHMADLVLSKESIIGNIPSLQDVSWIALTDAVEIMIANMQYPVEQFVQVHDSNMIDRDDLEAAWNSYATAVSRNNVTINDLVFKLNTISSNETRTYEWLVQAERTSLHDAWLQNLAWNEVQRNPWAKASSDTYDAQSGNDFTCASGCATQPKCLESIWDNVLEASLDTSEGCDIVLYTQQMSLDATDLAIDAHDIEGEPEVCNIAYIAANGALIESVFDKVPLEGMLQLGITQEELQMTDVEKLKAIKLERLNGRLLYRGWILLWAYNVPSSISHRDNSLLRLSPGQFFHSSVKYAMYVDQSFSTVPNSDDVRFLSDAMRTDSKQTRIYKYKGKPRSKILLGPETAKRAVVMLPQLKRQSSRNMKPLSDDAKLSLDQAVQFMMFEKGSKNVENVPLSIQTQQKYYQLYIEYMSQASGIRTIHSPVRPIVFNHWARTRWVYHDLQIEEARQFRCAWYKEHLRWGSKIDQFSLAKVMAEDDLYRKIKFDEQPVVYSSRSIESMTKGLFDHQEWNLLSVDKNRHVPSRYKAQVFSYDTPDAKLHAKAPHLSEPQHGTPLYSRIVSERSLSAARKAWRKAKALAESR